MLHVHLPHTATEHSVERCNYACWQIVECNIGRELCARCESSAYRVQGQGVFGQTIKS